jgi:hypothetical protein
VTKIVCGVDVSKRRLDAHVAPSGVFASFDNDAAGIAALARFCHRQGVQLVAMEATGGYERQPLLLLWAAGIACGLTNPRSVRRYAEAMGILEKTDRLDASVIARFAIAKELKPTSPPTVLQQRLNALVARLRQVTEDLTVNKQRRSSATSPEMIASLDEVIGLLKRQARTLQGEIASMIDDDPLWSHLDAALRTPKGLPIEPWPGCSRNCRRSASTPTRRWSSWPAWHRSPMIAVPGPVSGISAAAVPASDRSCSWSQTSRAASTRASLTFIEGSRQPAKRIWWCASHSPENSSSDSTPKHARREPAMLLQLDNPDSRSP